MKNVDTALETGVMAGQKTPFATILVFKFYEV